MALPWPVALLGCRERGRFDPCGGTSAGFPVSSQRRSIPLGKASGLSFSTLYVMFGGAGGSTISAMAPWLGSCALLSAGTSQSYFGVYKGVRTNDGTALNGQDRVRTGHGKVQVRGG